MPYQPIRADHALDLAQLLRDPFAGEAVARRVLVFEEIDSTNAYALSHGEDGLLVVADRQTTGRGRLGRTWHSAPGLGLWFSVVVGAPCDGLVFGAALSVRDALSPWAAAQIKWPNDILINARKICGILVEQRANRIVIGIGINVGHRREDFSRELRGKAGSLASEIGGEWDRCEVLRRVLNALDRNVILLRGGGFTKARDAWSEVCRLLGRNVRVDRATGVIESIDPTGALILNTPHGLRTVSSGDLEFLDGE